MKYFQVVENISSYLYVHHSCLKHMTFVTNKHKPMKKCFSHNFHYQTWDENFVMYIIKKEKVIEIQDEEKYDKMCDK